METGPGHSHDVVIDPGSREAIGRLFRADRFRFEFGMRRGDDRWFAPTPANHPALDERRRWLAAAPDDCILWRPEAAPVFAEMLELFGPSEGAADPAGLARLAARWEPDLLLLRRDGDGETRLVGGAVCFPSSWTPAEKLGLTVDAIHSPVPTVNAELGPRIRTFLARLPEGAVFERENWGLAAVPDMNMHPRLGLPRLGPGTPLEQVWLRLERQAFRALPKSGGVLFIIRLTVHPLEEALADPEVRAGFVRALATMPDEIAAYKGVAAVRAGLCHRLGARP